MPLLLGALSSLGALDVPCTPGDSVLGTLGVLGVLVLGVLGVLGVP